ncbi:hypothetical protein TNCV_452781 [Trichonephila clavipes]|nr:hypothetical protein TNCV_452781 [Trichonephila clavipes]
MELSPISRSNSSSRSSTPKPEKPITDCERRRNAMIKASSAEYHDFWIQTLLEKPYTCERRRSSSQGNGKATEVNHGCQGKHCKTAHPPTPTKVLEPVEVQNSYDNLDEDPEINVTETSDKPAPSPPQPIF